MIVVIIIVVVFTERERERVRKAETRKDHESTHQKLAPVVFKESADGRAALSVRFGTRITLRARSVHVERVEFVT